MKWAKKYIITFMDFIEYLMSLLNGILAASELFFKVKHLYKFNSTSSQFDDN